MEVDTPMGGQEQHPDHDDSMNTTITPSTIQAMPDYHHNNNAAAFNPANSQNSEGGGRPQTSYSDTGFSRPYSQNYQSFAPSSDADTPPKYGYSNNNNGMQQSQPRPSSRPPSAMSGTSQHDRGYDNSRSNSYQDQHAYQSQQQMQDPHSAKNPKVIIKVGMVGDAQIGKTSLMVKYVEGSWDEDYIQTLGKNCSSCHLHDRAVGLM